MRIDSAFDSGNVGFTGERGGRVYLTVRADSRSRFRQWFHFRATGEPGRRWRFAIANASRTTYADTWVGARIAASYDGAQWFRLPTRFNGRSLTFELEAAGPVCYFAYFAPYPLARQGLLLERAVQVPWIRVERVARTLEGREVPLLVVGEPGRGKRRVWVIARQHPGESMGGWFVEGLVHRLLDDEDPWVEALLRDAVLYLVPNMNPDGTVHGHHRTNAGGVDLNRAWLEPARDRSPEVVGVRARMRRTGVDLFLDVHGDERNPYCYLAGCEGNPGYSERLRALESLFAEGLAEACPDFEEGHEERDAPGEGDLKTAANWVGETFDCLSFTLEQPFRPDPEGLAPEWTPERAMRLGHCTLEPIVACLPALRDDR